IVIDTLKINISIRGTTYLCNGDTITLEADTGFTSYRWSNGAPTRSIRVWRPGAYSVTAIHATGCTTTSKEIVLDEIIPTPAIISSHNFPICKGDSLTLDAGPGYAKYKWSTGQQTQKIRVSNGGQYVVEVTTEKGCYGRDTIQITTIPKPFVDAGVDTTICTGGTVQLSAIGQGLLLWENSPSLSCLDCLSPIATPKQTTTYYLQAIGSNRCTARDSITVTVVPQPSATVSGDTTICAGASVRLSASGGTSIGWSPADGLSCSDCTSPIASPTATTTYRVVASNGGHCADTASITVTVAPLPELQISTDTTICSGGAAMLQALSASPIRWQPSDGLSCADCTNPIATPTTTTRYVAIATNELGCTARDSVTVTVAPMPTVEAGDDHELCSGDSVQLNATGTGTLSWSPSNGLRCTDCPNPMAAPVATTTYRITATNQYGCTASDSVTVRVNLSPRVLQTIIGQDIRGKLGGNVRVPLLINQDMAAAGATSLRVHLRYDTTIMRLTQPTAIHLESATKGTLLEGWKMTVEATGADTLLLLAEAPDGRIFSGVGEILAPKFTLFLGNTTQATVAAMVTLPNAPCTRSLPGSGVVMIDSVCGLNLRLIELSANNFSLQQNHPNPFNPQTSLHFSLGLDGHVTAEILDGSGKVVAQLIDQHMNRGRYTIDWDATAYPSGTYYFRIRSGDWQRSVAMMLVK
ncbi:MAG: T9SS type A sorting domain-containing protein, partial [Armatimonadetes bacterium]|nr:T9SS type A sorting domain-containing protein [Armatimonadota bacterium]